MTAAPPTAVVHLLREANGPGPFDAFLASYLRCPAGLDHELVLLLKGFADTGAHRPFLERAATAGVPVRGVAVSDRGFDLTAYASAARRLPHARLCFLNSFSEVLADGWLAKLSAALDEPGVGVAGATGSWESPLSLAARQAGLRNGYAAAFPDSGALIRGLHELGGTARGHPLAERLFVARWALRNARRLPRFPAVHVRTNAFLVGRQDFLALQMPELSSKHDAYAFESGRTSMTAQLRAAGLDAVTVDRHGVARRPAQWAASDLFRQAGQEDLLVADNQTRAYAAASPTARALLSRCTWGPQARPQ